MDDFTCHDSEAIFRVSTGQKRVSMGCYPWTNPCVLTLNTRNKLQVRLIASFDSMMLFAAAEKKQPKRI